MLSKVYINLIDQKEPKLNFSKVENEINEKQNSKQSYFKKVTYPSSNELKKHREYLKNNLKKNYF